MQTTGLDMEGLPPPSAVKWNDRWVRPYIMNINGTSAIDVIATLFSIHASTEIFLSFPVSPQYLLVLKHLSLQWET